MIQANELRIGNWVRYTRGDDKICFSIAEGELIDGIANNPFYQGIVLTPEILGKAGFIKGCPYSKNYGFTSPCKNFFFEKSYYLKEISSGQIISVQIKYVHHLQNLYFALTGTELEINL